jgi:predicted enzyme related to lactoylglutathione lyase
MTTAAVLYVKDLPTMRGFYEACFAMSAQHLCGEDFCVLESTEWELSLVRLAPSIAQTITITDPPRRRQGTPLKLAFEVSNIATAGSMIVAGGGQIDPPESAWKFRGRRHLDFVDPEGNVGQLRQRLAA